MLRPGEDPSVFSGNSEFCALTTSHLTDRWIILPTPSPLYRERDDNSETSQLEKVRTAPSEAYCVTGGPSHPVSEAEMLALPGLVVCTPAQTWHHLVSPGSSHPVLLLELLHPVAARGSAPQFPSGEERRSLGQCESGPGEPALSTPFPRPAVSVTN